MPIDSSSFEATDMGEFERWLDDADPSCLWQRSIRIVTGKGAYVVTVQPLILDDKPVRFVEDSA